ncbi:hypothetical protein ACR6C2_43090 [Streptomyces sp. INA 01156]
MVPLEQVTVPPQDRVRPDQQQQMLQLLCPQMVEQAGQHCPIDAGERRLADLALQDRQLTAERQNLDVLSRSLMVNRRSIDRMLVATR